SPVVCVPCDLEDSSKDTGVATEFGKMTAELREKMEKGDTELEYDPQDVSFSNQEPTITVSMDYYKYLVSLECCIRDRLEQLDEEWGDWVMDGGDGMQAVDDMIEEYMYIIRSARINSVEKGGD